MSEEQVLKIMADVGPHTKEALESWLRLQWLESFVGMAMFLAFWVLCAYAIKKIAGS